jgi:origin recognition complex subunit 6
MSGRRTPRSTKPERSTADTPDWVMPAIRTLAKSFNFPSAAPHIFTGVESVLPLLTRMAAATAETPSKRPRRTATTTVPDARIRCLVIVIALYVFTKLQDVDVTPEQYNTWRDTAIAKLMDLSTGEDVTYDELSLETEELLPMAQVEGWLQMEWFQNVTPQEDVDAMEGVEPSVAPEKRTTIKTGGSDYIGLGTMMQDATDYLSDQRREDYVRWKASVMTRVQQIEAA